MVTFPIPDAALANHIAVLGKTGSGKSSTSRTIVEHVYEQGSRICILDAIKSDWWGITSSPDGKAPGLPFKILGGPRGHVALPSSAGAVAGQLVATGKLPLSIIDMAFFEGGGLQRFFVDFADTLMRQMRGVLYLVVEEAHEFAPKERAGFGAENQAIHFAKKLATAGRSKGVRLIVATQRVQALHNAVLGSCETVIAHRLTAPADQQPVVKWMQANTDKATAAQVADSLASLPRGRGWLCSGEAKLFELVDFPKFATFDNTATPMSDEEAIQVRTAPVDQVELKALIGDATKEAEANDPKALRARIVQLEAEAIAARRGLPTGPDAETLKAADAAGYERGYGEAWDRAEAAAAARQSQAVAVLDRPLADFSTARPAPKSEAPKIPPAEAPRPATAPDTPARPPKAAQPNLSGAAGLVQAAGSVHPVRLTWGQIAALAGRKPSGGHFNSSRKASIDNGWLTESGGLIGVTPAGLAEFGIAERQGDPADVFAEALPQPAAKMFAAIRERPGITLVGLASVLQMQPRGGHWNTGMSMLRKNSLIREDAGGLFPAPLGEAAGR